jgi:hypothetical protein
MASVVQICNMALSHIGSEGRVASISPPDGSVEAGHCATFYDQARTEMLEPGNWAFALQRAALAQVANVSTTWAYAYAKPADCMSAKRVLRPGSTLTVFTQDNREYSPNDQDSATFEIEGEVLYSNEPDAVLIYVRDITDTTRFTPSFSAALGYLLGAYLAGPIVKGNEGLKLGDAMRQRATALADLAAASSANASQTEHAFVASQLVARA